MEPSLLPTKSVQPLEYSENAEFNLGKDCTIDDVCDFVVEYINSDILVSFYPVNSHLQRLTTQLLRAFSPTDSWSLQVRLCFVMSATRRYTYIVIVGKKTNEDR